MPRRETLFAPEQYCHVYNRGNNRQAVFYDENNYVYFLRGIKKYLQETMVVIAYCLMPTHYHLLVRIKAALQTSEVSETSEVYKSAKPTRRQCYASSRNPQDRVPRTRRARAAADAAA